MSVVCSVCRRVIEGRDADQHNASRLAFPAHAACIAILDSLPDDDEGFAREAPMSWEAIITETFANAPDDDAFDLTVASLGVAVAR